MIEFENRDITTVTHGIVGHGVNCSHGFGSGVAGAIKKRHPIVRKRFMDMPSGAKMLGTTHIIVINDDLTYANLYTQVNYGYDGKKYADLDAVKKCLYDLFMYATTMDITDVYLPQIGCKRGGLDWDTQVFPVINSLAEQFKQLKITICIYEG